MSDEQSLNPTGAADLPTCAHCGDPITPGDACPGRASYHVWCHTTKDRAWRTSPEGLYQRWAILRSYRDRHPDRIRARNAVHAAVRRGELPPLHVLACVSCARQAEQYDHADGYAPAAWLQVEPVCASCHYERRLQRGEVRAQEPDRGLHGLVVPELLAEFAAVRAAYERAFAGREQRREEFRAWVREQRDLERAATARHHAERGLE